MLTQEHIDKLHNDTSKYGAYIYYIANVLELYPNDRNRDRLFYKLIPEFRILKIKVVSVYNAYFEYLNFVNNPNDYHVETLESYSADGTKIEDEIYVHNYIREPSIIYGKNRSFYKNNVLVQSTVDPSPISPKYTNTLSYDYVDDVQEAMENGELDWKYLALDSPITVDDTEYNYVTSDYYVLETSDSPIAENPLVKVNQKSEYFYTLEEAMLFLKEFDC